MDTVHENDAKPRTNPGVTMGGYTWPSNSGDKNIPKSTGLSDLGGG